MTQFHVLPLLWQGAHSNIKKFVFYRIHIWKYCDTKEWPQQCKWFTGEKSYLCKSLITFQNVCIFSKLLVGVVNRETLLQLKHLSVALKWWKIVAGPSLNNLTPPETHFISHLTEPPCFTSQWYVAPYVIWVATCRAGGRVRGQSLWNRTHLPWKGDETPSFSSAPPAPPVWKLWCVGRRQQQCRWRPKCQSDYVECNLKHSTMKNLVTFTWFCSLIL